jgi:hypothetical protein
MFRRPGFFVAGACFGAVVARRWRPLVKRAIVVGVVGGEMVKTGAARMAENLSDVTHEAMAELQVDGTPASAANGESVNGESSTGSTAVASFS